VLTQKTDFILQSSDLLLLVVKSAIELADQFMSAENRFLTLLSQLSSKEDDLLGQDSLNVRCPIQPVKRRFGQQLLYEVVRFHCVMSLGETP